MQTKWYDKNGVKYLHTLGECMEELRGCSGTSLKIFMLSFHLIYNPYSAYYFLLRFTTN